MTMIKLTMVTGERQPAPRPFDEDAAEAGEPLAMPPPEETTSPVRINPEEIRCFYPRKEGRRGTRLTFKNSSGMAVTETFEQVEAALGLQ